MSEIEFGYKVTTTPRADGRIIQVLESVSNGIVESTMRSVLETQDQQTRDALIALGWTPPDKARAMTERTGATAYTDSQLLERAIALARRKSHHGRPRWAHVQYAFGLGSSFARQLCERFGLDPDEVVK